MTNEDALQLIETLKSRRTLALSAVAELSAAFAGTPFTFDISAHLEVRVHCGGVSFTLVRCEWLDWDSQEGGLCFRTSQGTGPTGSFMIYKPGETWGEFLKEDRPLSILHEALLHAPTVAPVVVAPVVVAPVVVAPVVVDSRGIPTYEGWEGSVVNPQDIHDRVLDLTIRRAAREIACNAQELFRERGGVIDTRSMYPYMDKYRLHDDLDEVIKVVVEYLLMAGWPVEATPLGVAFTGHRKLSTTEVSK